ncbi:sugar ABC transporter permease [Cohnella faecalis]|uniref:Sugar ABC transporter permease n=1 Tax=Cohnella faecalis TaxID=2315694 RepID=A0A398CK88_9BACL|nr:sugar ABC transporter permease [Cohnella faecalis]RIE01288.1 sugar ABC transporter permease [Cohnella faecalis]
MAIWKDRLATGAIYAGLILILVITVYPLIWVVGTSLNPGNGLLITRMFPEHPTFQQYSRLIGETDFAQWYFNTLKISFSNMALSTLLIAVSAYAFSRFRFKGRKAGLMILLVLQMFPGFLSIMALFVLLMQTKLLDTHLGLILIYAGGSISFGIWVMKGFFDTIPKSLEEAALIDGANQFDIFVKIMLPLSLPALTFVMMNSFIGPMMDFILPQIVLRSPEKQTLAQGLYNMVSDKMNSGFAQFAAGAVLTALPITIIYTLFQKYLIHGLTAGADKG